MDRRSLVCTPDAGQDPGAFRVGGEVPVLLPMQEMHWTHFPAAVALAKYLERAPMLSGGRCKVLELGSGGGLASIAAALLGHHAVASDIQTIAEENGRANRAQIEQSGGSFRFVHLDWNDFMRCEAGIDEIIDSTRLLEGSGRKLDFHVVIASDVVWIQRFFEPFFITARRLIQSHDESNRPTLILAHNPRGWGLQMVHEVIAAAQSYGFVQIGDLVSAAELPSAADEIWEKLLKHHAHIYIMCFKLEEG